MNKPTASYALFQPYSAASEQAIQEKTTLPTRGITWVFRWAMAVAVLALAVLILADFVYCLAAELRLARAARAAAMEATLPRATYDTVCRVAKRRLADNSGVGCELRVSLIQNGAPTGRVLWPKPGDRIAVMLTVSKSAVRPYWLRWLILATADEQITVRAARTLPGKDFSVIGAGSQQFER